MSACSHRGAVAGRQNCIPFRVISACFALVYFGVGSLTAETSNPTLQAQFDESERNPVGHAKEWITNIVVHTPEYRADIQGDVTVSFRASGMSHVRASCWQQPTAKEPSPWGHDSVIIPAILLDEQGEGKFVFPADQYPHGPLTVRIHARGEGQKQDICQLQLYNKGGVRWNEGIPKTNPPAAQGMKLVFADDFNGRLSISHDGKGARYQSHKTGGGDFSGWGFGNLEDGTNPFGQVDTYLRIRAAKRTDGKGSTGLLSSANEERGGFYAAAPAYFECRFLAQSAPGTWPAFWLLSKGSLNKPNLHGTDELDIIEAYGGLGWGNPNFPGYAVTSHYWGQKDSAGKPKKDDSLAAGVPMLELGGKSSWSTTFHTYGLLLTDTDTVYYCDDIEVFRHPSGSISKTEPFWFLINYAIGGISGWKIDLERYKNASDMYVDFVRVYAGGKRL